MTDCIVCQLRGTSSARNVNSFTDVTMNQCAIIQFGSIISVQHAGKELSKTLVRCKLLSPDTQDSLQEIRSVHNSERTK